jgi:hypothetical protein
MVIIFNIRSLEEIEDFQQLYKFVVIEKKTPKIPIGESKF